MASVTQTLDSALTSGSLLGIWPKALGCDGHVSEGSLRNFGPRSQRESLINMSAVVPLDAFICWI